MKRLMEVEIFGQTFTLNSEDDDQYVRKVASFVDQRMRQISGSAKVTVPLRVAIMAALSIADELAKSSEQESGQQEREVIREAELISNRLLESLEKAELLENGETADTTASRSSSLSSAIPDEEEKKVTPLAS